MQTTMLTVQTLASILASTYAREAHAGEGQPTTQSDPEEQARRLRSRIYADLYLLHLELFKAETEAELDASEDLDESLLKLNADENAKKVARHTQPLAKRALLVPLYRQFADKKPETHLTCQLCGGKYKHLANHLYKYHGVSTEEYQLDYPETEYFLSEKLRVQYSEQGERYLTGSKRILRDDEIEFVKNNFSTMTNRELARALNVSLASLNRIIVKYIEEKKINQQAWQEEETAYLKQHYLTKSYAEIATDLNRTEERVKNKAFLLGLKKEEPGLLWTQAEERYLHENYKKCTYAELAAYLGRTQYSVKTKLERMRLRKVRSAYKWSDAERDYVKKNYSSKTAEELASAIGCPVDTVRRLIQKIGLKKNHNFQ